MLSLHSNRSYFILSNIIDKQKEGGFGLQDPSTGEQALCIDFDVTSKGSRMVVGGMSKVGCFLSIIKITHFGFVSKSFDNRLENVQRVLISEKVYMPTNHPYVLVSTLYGVCLFGLSKYDLIFIANFERVISGNHF